MIRRQEAIYNKNEKNHLCMTDTKSAGPFTLEESLSDSTTIDCFHMMYIVYQKNFFSNLQQYFRYYTLAS